MNSRPGTLISKVLQPATGRAALTPTVIGLTALISVVLHISSSPDLGTNALAVRTVLAAVAVLPIFAVIWAAMQIKIRSELLRGLWILGTYVIAGSLRGFGIALPLRAMGLGIEEGWQFRIPASMISMSVTVAILTFGWETFRTHRNYLMQLASQTQQMQAAFAELEVEAKAEARQRVGSVVNDIIAELDQIELHPVGDQVTAIERVINERVRPLSRELADDIREWNPVEVSTELPGFRSAWTKQNPLDNLPHWWNALLVAIAPVPVAVYWFGWQQALWLWLAFSLTLTPMLQLSKWAVARLFRGWNSPAREVGLTVVFVFDSLPAGIASHFLLSDTPTPDLLIVPGMVSIPVFAWMVTIAQTLHQETRDRTAELEMVRDELRWAIARLGLLSWFHRGLVSRMLHGPIQNALHATLIRLRDQQPQQVVEGVISELRERMAGVNEANVRADGGHRGLSDAFARISELWTGIAVVDYKLSPDAESVLAIDSPAAAIVSDMCQELVSNAIRHASASELQISVTSTRKVIKVALTDNGNATAGVGAAGVGTRLLDACSIEWASQREGNANKLVVLIPSM